MSKPKLSVLAAQTHPPEYQLHKYWSRKPHNVIAAALRSLLHQPGVIVDPFCGSGVVAREASLLGHEVYAFELNPIAYLLSTVTCHPPSLEPFLQCVDEILAAWKEDCDRAYQLHRQDGARTYQANPQNGDQASQTNPQEGDRTSQTNPQSCAQACQSNPQDGAQASPYTPQKKPPGSPRRASQEASLPRRQKGLEEPPPLIRYVVHATVVRCPACQKEQSAPSARRQGRTFRCSACQQRLLFNLEHLCRTEVIGLACSDRSGLVTQKDLLCAQQEASLLSWSAEVPGQGERGQASSLVEPATFSPWSSRAGQGERGHNLSSFLPGQGCAPGISKELRSDLRSVGPSSPGEGYALPLAENRRILAFAGMDTSSLFTRRNWSLLCALADCFHAIEEEPLRQAALLLLTASVAQCSRLIPYRNNMTTGGPAWSVPGFWVPPIHLETNPYPHLLARRRKFERGLSALVQRPAKGGVTLYHQDALSGLSRLQKTRPKVDLLFLDPPYGDSVPYLEFSALWNGFLRCSPPLKQDLSVSDRTCQHQDWTRYASLLQQVVARATALLAPEGKLLLTFNNHDLRAWEALLTALHRQKMACLEVLYQIPAVVSSKAAFHPQKSYVGDLYAVYKGQEPSWTPSLDLSPLCAALQRCASSRDGVISPNLAWRTLAVSWMEHNLSAELLGKASTLLDSLFERREGLLHWRGEVDPQIPRLADLAWNIASSLLAQGPLPWPQLYQTIARDALSLGLPDPGEIRLLLQPRVLFAQRRCSLR